MRQRRFIRLLRISVSHDPYRAAHSVALDTGICPISLRNQRPEFLRNFDATRRPASACRSLT
jgi:hypothetical protein